MTFIKAIIRLAYFNDKYFSDFFITFFDTLNH